MKGLHVTRRWTSDNETEIVRGVYTDRTVLSSGPLTVVLIKTRNKSMEYADGSIFWDKTRVHIEKITAIFTASQLESLIVLLASMQKIAAAWDNATPQVSEING